MDTGLFPERGQCNNTAMNIRRRPGVWGLGTGWRRDKGEKWGMSIIVSTIKMISL